MRLPDDFKVTFHFDGSGGVQEHIIPGVGIVRAREISPEELPANLRTEVVPCEHLGEATGEEFPPADGLGDKVANLLDSVGLSKEKYAELRGLETEDCGCNWRQNLINRIGGFLGFGKGKGADIQRLVNLLELPQGPVFKCAMHGECIRHFNIKEPEARQIIQSAGVNMCRCDDYKPKETPHVPNTDS